MIDKSLIRLGESIAKLRIARNLKQSELAYEAGVSERTLQRLEAGNVAKTDGLLKVIHQLGRLEEFLTAVEPPAFSPYQLAQEIGNKRSKKLSSSVDSATWNRSRLFDRKQRVRVRHSGRREDDNKDAQSALVKKTWPEDQK